MGAVLDTRDYATTLELMRAVGLKGGPTGSAACYDAEGCRIDLFAWHQLPRLLWLLMVNYAWLTRVIPAHQRARPGRHRSRPSCALRSLCAAPRHAGAWQGPDTALHGLRLESLQGANSTYYGGEVMSFATVEICARYAKALVECFFKRQSSQSARLRSEPFAEHLSLDGASASQGCRAAEPAARPPSFSRG